MTCCSLIKLLIFRNNDLSPLFEPVCIYQYFINCLALHVSSLVVFQGPPNICTLLTSADVWRLSPDHEGAAQAARVPEQEEQGDKERPEAHHGDLKHGYNVIK